MRKQAHVELNEPGVKTLYIDIFVGRCFTLAPKEQTFFGRHFYSRHEGKFDSERKDRRFTFDGNVLNGEAENNRPDHSECHFKISIDDF